MAEARGRESAVATIGVFDGVHLGHQALLRTVVERAEMLGARSVCVTFSPHPEDVLRPASRIEHLAPVEDRLSLIEAVGVSEVMLLEFTLALSRMSPEEFIDLLEARLELKELWIGSDFALGRDRVGGPDRLAAIGASRGFRVTQFPPVLTEGEVVSSSRIRQLLNDGDVREAGRLLGRAYRIRGRVVLGNQRGRLLGFPTANLDVQERLCLPSDGIYAVSCRMPDSAPHPAVVSLGVRPTFGGGERLLEVHLLDFEGDLYGTSLAVDFVARLRDQERFSSPESLIAQMREDVREAADVLRAGGTFNPQS